MNSEITFLVFTYNEERRLEYYLRCIEGRGRIIVIDNYSTDRTREIAMEYAESVHLYSNPGYIENQETISFALSLVRSNWVYLGYVDELLPKDLLNELEILSRQSQYKIVEIYRKNYMYGKEVFNYDYKPTLRMFIPGVVDFKNNVIHKLGRYLVPSSQVFKFNKLDSKSIWHFSSYCTSQLELVHNRYANIEAPQIFKILNKEFSGLRLLCKPFFYFWATYLGFGGFRAGWPGFFISVQIAYFKFSVEARLWELSNEVNMEGIELKYNMLKERLIEDEKYQQ